MVACKLRIHNSVVSEISLESVRQTIKSYYSGPASELPFNWAGSWFRSVVRHRHNKLLKSHFKFIILRRSRSARLLNLEDCLWQRLFTAPRYFASTNHPGWMIKPRRSRVWRYILPAVVLVVGGILEAGAHFNKIELPSGDLQRLKQSIVEEITSCSW